MWIVLAVVVGGFVLFVIIGRTRPSPLEETRALLREGKAIHAQIAAQKTLRLALRKGATSPEAIEARLLLATAQTAGHEPESALETLRTFEGEGATALDAPQREAAVRALLGAARTAQAEGQAAVARSCYTLGQALAPDDTLQAHCADELKRMSKGKAARWQELEKKLGAQLTQRLQTLAGAELIKAVSFDTSGGPNAVQIDFGREPTPEEAEKLRTAVQGFIDEQSTGQPLAAG